MKPKIGIIYSTVDGQTLKICNKLREVLQQNDQEVDLISIDDFKEDITKYDKLVIGASIRYGVHNPNIVKVFAGKLDYKKYSFFDRKMIQLIMWMTKGPTNTDAEIEYTNWEKVNEFALELINL